MATTRKVVEDKLWRLDGGVTRLFLRKCGMSGAGVVDYYTTTDVGKWTENPITRILSDSGLFNRATQVGLDMPEIRSKDGQLPAVFWARAQVICQQLLWHHGNYGRQPGPEGDSIPKTLRKLWYAGHKAAFQQISNRTGAWRQSETVINDKSANQALSQIYGQYIDTGHITYLDAFIVDASRMFYHNPDPLPEPYNNILICVEKDAAYADMVSIGKALGARCVVSGGGKMGKAGTENMLRTCFSNYYDGVVGDLINWSNKLRIIVISDWDYDGEAVIAPTFVQQILRYVSERYIEWSRVGIKPDQLEEFGRDVVRDPSVSYEAKSSNNSGYSSWCAEKAVYIFEGQLFNGLYEVMDYDEFEFKRIMADVGIGPGTFGAMFPEYGSREDRLLKDMVDDWRWEGRQGLHPRLRFLTHKELVRLFDHFTPLGFELDAIRRVEYADVIAGALETVADWDGLLEALSEAQEPDTWDVARYLASDTLNRNEQYKKWGEEIREIREKAEKDVAQLEQARRQMAQRFHDAIEQSVIKFKDDERVFGEDPSPTTADLGDALKEHFDADDWAEHWQPYDAHTRARLLRELMQEERYYSLNRFANCTMDYEFTEEDETE